MKRSPDVGRLTKRSAKLSIAGVADSRPTSYMNTIYIYTIYIQVSLVGCIDRLPCVIAQSCSHWHIKSSEEKKKEAKPSISDVAFCKSALNSEINASQVMRKRACQCRLFGTYGL